MGAQEGCGADVLMVMHRFGMMSIASQVWDKLGATSKQADALKLALHSDARKHHGGKLSQRQLAV